MRLLLESDLQTKLDQAMIRHGGCNFAECRAAQRALRAIEVWAIGEIKGLGTKLCVRPLGHSEFSEQRQVDIHQFGPVQDVASGCSKLSGRRLAKGSHVEPLLTGTDASQYGGLADHVRTVDIAGRIQAGAADPNVQR